MPRREACRRPATGEFSISNLADPFATSRAIVCRKLDLFPAEV